MKTKSFLKATSIAFLVVACSFGFLNSSTSYAQASDEEVDVAGIDRAAAGGTAGGGGSNMGCYIITVLECGSIAGSSIGQQSFCSFTGVYGPPYRCEGFGCYGTITRRRCVLGS